MQLKQILDKKRFLYGRVLSNGWQDYERTRLDRYRPSGVFLFNSFMTGFTGVMNFLSCPTRTAKKLILINVHPLCLVLSMSLTA